MPTIARGGRALGVLFGAGLLALMAVPLVLWHASPLTLLETVIGAVSLVAIALNPYVGVHAFILLLYLEYALTVGGTLTLMKLLGVVIIGSWLLSMAARRRFDLRFDSFALALVLFLAWTAASLLYAYDSGAAERSLFGFSQFGLLALMFSSVVDDVEKMRGVCWAIVVWTVLSTIIAIGMYYAGATRYAVGLLANKNLLADYINVAIVCAHLLLLSTTHRPAKLFLASTLPPLYLGLALTLSRTGLIILGALLLVVWYRVARQRGFLILVSSVIALALITFVLPSTFFKRASTILPAIERQQDTFGTRVRLWRIAGRMIADHPLTGVGSGNFIAAYPRYAHGEMKTRLFVTHNAYVGMAAEMGLVGLTLFLALIGLALREAGRAIRIAKRMGLRDLGYFAVAAEVSLLSMALSGLAGNVEGSKMLWMLFGFAVGIGRVARSLALTEGRAVVPLTTSVGTPAGAPLWTQARIRP
jgi:putative inorganic carbon (HCO3(-)) transporter